MYYRIDMRCGQSTEVCRLLALRALPQFVSCRILARKVFSNCHRLPLWILSGEGLSTTDAADPSVLTDPSTVKTNLIPERIEKTYSVSSQMMTSTNSGPETVVFPNVVGGGVMSQTLSLEGFEGALDGTMGDVLPPSGQASLRDLLCIFHHPPTDHQPHYPMEEWVATTAFCSANATKATRDSLDDPMMKPDIPKVVTASEAHPANEWVFLFRVLYFLWGVVFSAEPWRNRRRSQRFGTGCASGGIASPDFSFRPWFGGGSCWTRAFGTARSAPIHCAWTHVYRVSGTLHRSQNEEPFSGRI